MKIIVSTLGGTNVDPLTLDVDSQAMLSDLKTLIRESTMGKTGMVLQLILNTTPLDDHLHAATLEDLGMEDGTTLIMIWEKPVFVLTVSFDKTAKIWDASTGECKQTFLGHNGPVTSAAFSADGLSLLTASDDNTAKIWVTSTGECKQTFSGHSEIVKSAVFSADALSVLTASSDRTAKIWDASTGECKQTFSGHSDRVVSAVFSEDGLLVVTASHDKTAKIWDASTGECKQTLSHSNLVLSASFA